MEVLYKHVFHEVIARERARGFHLPKNFTSAFSLSFSFLSAAVRDPATSPHTLCVQTSFSSTYFSFSFVLEPLVLRAGGPCNSSCKISSSSEELGLTLHGAVERVPARGPKTCFLDLALPLIHSVASTTYLPSWSFTSFVKRSERGLDTRWEVA